MYSKLEILEIFNNTNSLSEFEKVLELFDELVREKVQPKSIFFYRAAQMTIRKIKKQNNQ